MDRLSNEISACGAIRSVDLEPRDTGNPAGVPSVLFPNAEYAGQAEARETPEFFHDLHLDRVIEAIIAGREAYDVAPFFHARLTDPDAVVFRHEVMHDLEDPIPRRAIESFAERMRTVRRFLAIESHYEREKQRWLVAAVETYAEGVEELAGDLGRIDLASRGLRAFRAHLAAYASSEAFLTLVAEARAVTEELGAIRYCLLIREGSVTVRPSAREADYSAAVEETFRKFQEGRANEYRYDVKDAWGMNHVEAQVADRVALLNPDAFAALARFCARHADFVDPTIARFDREVQFYAAYLVFADRLRRAGLSFCYPEVSAQRKDVFARETFDIALADALVRENATVVCNDFFLQCAERILVVSGPNQGGKTTFARIVGQLHHLASLGCPVPGREARLFLCDRLFTHFEREEDISSLHGKLEDDLIRIRRILEQATPSSILIINEIFSSTTVEDALFLGREVLERIVQRDVLCVCVTFLDELSALGPTTVSMVAAVDTRDPSLRTFKIERRPANGLAYALAIAEKHRVTYRSLLERIPT